MIVLEYSKLADIFLYYFEELFSSTFIAYKSSAIDLIIMIAVNMPFAI